MDGQNVSFWSKEWADIQSSLSSIRCSIFPSSPFRIMRASQIDSNLLDLQLFGILKEQLWKTFSLFKPQFREDFEPELLAALQLVMYRFSIYESGASYGAQLQNLKYQNERRHSGGLQSTQKDAVLTKSQKYAFSIMTIGGPYIWMRINRFVTAKRWSELNDDDARKIFWKCLQHLENLHKILSLANFLAFLYDGKYRTLVDRILTMRFVYARQMTRRHVNFEFMNRQLVWHAFTEFLLFLMPFINFRRVKNILKHVSYSKPQAFDFLPAHICAICYEQQMSTSTSSITAVSSTRLHNSYETSCGHQYCYYCIKMKMIQEGRTWKCLRCGEEIKDIRRTLDKVFNENDDYKGKHPTIQDQKHFF
ncbi:Pex12 amino terminal region-domain-containing protein [Gigaspora rosea]|uniref:RING-type E3 ubiquitin transferase (cysteine targeting) n=1 Tax=Gigaspora rosea TaxID=44941 RepID=A0A397VGL7_9GLOM|nr:Pex12 amino terminal region-domain-containing protein [Gigaspora rosea]